MDEGKEIAGNLPVGLNGVGKQAERGWPAAHNDDVSQNSLLVASASTARCVLCSHLSVFCLSISHYDKRFSPHNIKIDGELVCSLLP